MKAPLPKINVRDSEVMQAKNDIDEYAGIISRIVKTVVEECTKDLDEELQEVRQALKNASELSDEELIYCISNLPVLMYYTADKMEEIGIKSDSSTAVKRERYDTYFSLAVGRTIPDKQSETNELVKSEAVVEQAYKRAYKKVQSKLDNANSLLASLKKVLSYRSEVAQNNNEGFADNKRRRRNGISKDKGEVF